MNLVDLLLADVLAQGSKQAINKDKFISLIEAAIGLNERQINNKLTKPASINPAKINRSISFQFINPIQLKTFN